MSLKEMQAALAAMSSNGEKEAAVATFSPEDRRALFKAVGEPPLKAPSTGGGKKVHLPLDPLINGTIKGTPSAGGGPWKVASFN